MVPGSAVPGSAVFGSAVAAVAAAEAALAFLAGLDVVVLTGDEQAEVLRGLERMSSRLVAVRSRTLSAFVSGGGLEADGQCSARGWLVWRSRVTRGAAGASVGWQRRLARHPVLERGLVSGELSESWVRQLADWTDRLPEDLRQDADRILAEAAAGGADLPDLAGLAREMRERVAGPDEDGDRGFADRRVRLEQTYEGAGRLDGDLTPECAAALGAVLESLGKRAGPEDDRSREQRDHDALEEACRRLIAAGCLPDVAGQPVLIQLHATLDDLAAGAGEAAGTGAAGTGAAGNSAGGTGTAEADAAGAAVARAAARARAGGLPEGAAWLSAAAAEAYGCDARIAPLVTGRVDPAALAWMVHDFMDGSRPHGCQVSGCTSPACRAQSRPPCGPHQPPYPLSGESAESSRGQPPGSLSAGMPAQPSAWPPGPPSGRFLDKPPESPPGQPPEPLPGRLPGPRPEEAAWVPPGTAERLGDALARYAVQVLSGPGGLAAALRARAGGPTAAGVSLPLDTGAPTATVPSHLRRAVTARDRHCAFPGCAQVPAACQVHHIIPRSRGGVTALHNLALLCSFHHLIAVHRWGWSLVLHGDGTTTATSPDGNRTLHSHGPPAASAA